MAKTDTDRGTLDDKTKAEIDAMSYERMLSLQRFAPMGHPMFQGDTGDYFGKRMAAKKSEVGQAEHVRASKSIGW